MQQEPDETPEERKRRKAKERQRRKRQKDKEHKDAVGAKDFRFEIYRGTAEALERITTAGGFEEEAEVLTLLIHRADELAKRDPSQFQKLVSVKRHVKREHK